MTVRTGEGRCHRGKRLLRKQFHWSLVIGSSKVDNLTRIGDGRTLQEQKSLCKPDINEMELQWTEGLLGGRRAEVRRPRKGNLKMSKNI